MTDILSFSSFPPSLLPLLPSPSLCFVISSSWGPSGRTNCIEQCANRFILLYKECKAVGVALTQENKNEAQLENKEAQDNEQPVPYEIVDGLKQCRDWDNEKPDGKVMEIMWNLNDANADSTKISQMDSSKLFKKKKQKKKKEEEEMKTLRLNIYFYGALGNTAKNLNRNKLHDILSQMDVQVKGTKNVPTGKKDLAQYVGGRKFLRRVSTLQNVARLVDMLGVKLADLRGDSLMFLQNGATRLKHMQEALIKQSTVLETVAGSASSRQEKLIENVRNYFTTSTNSDAVEALAELYPITMTSLSDARMLFAKHCKTEREVKNLQVRLFSTIENLGMRASMTSISKNVQNKEKKQQSKDASLFGLFSFKGATFQTSPFDGDTALWELQCVRQHEQKIKRANQGFINKMYLSDSGAKRARGLHILEHRRTMVCPLCVSLVTNELDDNRESILSMRGLEKGTMSSVFAFCQSQSDPYFKTTCHHVATGLEDILSNVLASVSNKGSDIEDAPTLLLRTNPASLRLLLDRLLSPDGSFSQLGGGDATLWREAEGMDGPGGNQSPKLLIAADVCHKFMACDAYASGGGSASSSSSKSEVGDASGAASMDDSGGGGGGGGDTSDMMLDEGVKLLEKWDAQNDNAAALEEITKHIVKLAESSHDRMVCDDFKRVQSEYASLRRKSEVNGHAKLCYACVKMATLSVRDALGGSEVEEEEGSNTVKAIFHKAEESICEPALWKKTQDSLRDAMKECEGGGSGGSSSGSKKDTKGDKSKGLLLLLEQEMKRRATEGPATHATNYVKKLNLPLSCPALEEYFDTSKKGTRRVTSKDIATFTEQLQCAREVTKDEPERTYDSKVCKTFVSHLHDHMLKRLQELAMLHAFPTNVAMLDGDVFLKLLAKGNGGDQSSDDVVYDFANDVCTRPGMGCVADSR